MEWQLRMWGSKCHHPGWRYYGGESVFLGDVGPNSFLPDCSSLLAGGLLSFIKAKPADLMPCAAWQRVQTCTGYLPSNSG